MANTIFVLEDDEQRTVSMRNLVSTVYPQHDLVFIDNAPDSIDWLHANLHLAVLICLDHDLGPNRQRHGHVFDPGIGRDVVEFMVTREPTCPVIIHSTNNPAAYGMRARLKEAGWTWSRIIPYGDLEWISELWFPKVMKHLGK